MLDAAFLGLSVLSTIGLVVSEPEVEARKLVSLKPPEA